MTKNFINFFHGFIIAVFVLSFNGCGYKGDPIYVDDSKVEKKEIAK